MTHPLSAWTRPATLAEVACAATSLESFHRNLRDFLHAFQGTPDRNRVAEEPELMRERFDGGLIADAYLAAVAVELCTDLGCRRPTWTQSPSRVLARPWFAGKSDDLRVILLHESPAGFRERNLFVSENALSVG